MGIREHIPHGHESIDLEQETMQTLSTIGESHIEAKIVLIITIGGGTVRQNRSSSFPLFFSQSSARAISISRRVRDQVEGASAVTGQQQQQQVRMHTRSDGGSLSL